MELLCQQQVMNFLQQGDILLQEFGGAGIERLDHAVLPNSSCTLCSNLSATTPESIRNLPSRIACLIDSTRPASNSPLVDSDFSSSCNLLERSEKLMLSLAATLLEVLLSV